MSCAESLWDEIRSCRACRWEDANRLIFPFSFPFQDQKIMVMSVTPSPEATFKPLPSVSSFGPFTWRCMVAVEASRATHRSRIS